MHTKIYKKTKSSWNKGLTKKTDKRVKKISENNKNNISWNKGLTKETDERIKKAGYKQSKSILLTHKKRKFGFQKGNTLSVGEKNGMFGKYGEKAPNWKGNNILHDRMHKRIISKKGKASEYKCVDCGKQAKDWSNKDHLYSRILDDYSPRCRRCHQIYDKNIEI